MQHKNDMACQQQQSMRALQLEPNASCTMISIRPLVPLYACPLERPLVLRCPTTSASCDISTFPPSSEKRNAMITAVQETRGRSTVEVFSQGRRRQHRAHRFLELPPYESAPLPLPWNVLTVLPSFASDPVLSLASFAPSVST